MKSRRDFVEVVQLAEGIGVQRQLVEGLLQAGDVAL